MAIRNGDEVKFQGENGEIRGKVLTISRKEPYKGLAYVSNPGLKLGIWIDVGQLSKV